MVVGDGRGGDCKGCGVMLFVFSRAEPPSSPTPADVLRLGNVPGTWHCARVCAHVKMFMTVPSPWRRLSSTIAAASALPSPCFRVKSVNSSTTTHLQHHHSSPAPPLISSTTTHLQHHHHSSPRTRTASARLHTSFLHDLAPRKCRRVSTSEAHPHPTPPSRHHRHHVREQLPRVLPHDHHVQGGRWRLCCACSLRRLLATFNCHRSLPCRAACPRACGMR